jgi:hypothetical protein
MLFSSICETTNILIDHEMVIEAEGKKKGVAEERTRHQGEDGKELQTNALEFRKNTQDLGKNLQGFRKN